MDATVYMFAAFSAFWLFSFGYMYTLVNRQKKLEKQLAVMEDLVDQKQTD
jgi:CcmD family protein